MHGALCNYNSCSIPIWGGRFLWIVTKTELWAALPVVMFPFIPGDIVKCLVASWLATKIKI